MTNDGLRARPYGDGDLPRLQRTVADWIARAGRCGYDHIGELPHRIYENLRGRPIADLVHVWERGEELAGITICVRFGAAFDVFTAPELRGSPVEREMIEAAARTTARFMDRPAAGEWTLTDVFDCDTTRQRLLGELGFERFRVWDDITECVLSDRPAAVAVPDGFVLRTARRGDAEQLAAARNAAFGGSWTGGLYRSAVMDRPGYDPRREIVAATGDGRIGAFAVYWIDERNRIGHLEPVGTHPRFQRRGLARAVTREAMTRMLAAGMRLATVNHDAENLPAKRLYESLGFVRRHQTYGYRRRRPA